VESPDVTWQMNTRTKETPKMEGIVKHVCVSEEKGTVKGAVQCVNLIVDHGIEGDAHAGSWHRQISILDESDIEVMREKGLNLEPGAFGENLIVEGLKIAEFGIGTLLKVGDARLELSQIGKVCHNRCAIYHKTGDCIMPRSGLFARVIEGGRISSGIKIKPLHIVSRQAYQPAVIAVADGNKL